MEIVFHAHNAVISDRLHARAAAALDRMAARFPGAVDSVVRFERDGASCRVEIVLHKRRNKRLVAEGRGRTYGPALSLALKHLETQLAHDKRVAKERARLAGRA